ncbi:transcription initiation protein SPT3 homolog isoform X3 [Acropora muricata]|uniref:transcription initiation protein SPT3 homolog isoform X5 n=1 Tax=Acropora millepora TaxID=45264 RepID=UPI001CF18E6B|nr:transcription initiation protein SPT3 homolog isoform X5 [Acropora millepora]
MTKSKSKSKKGEKGKEASTLPNSSDSKPPSSCDSRPPTPAIQSPVTLSSKLPKPWFQSEIQSMMYAFGDSRKPSSESATLIEQIVHSQMSNMVVRAADVTNMRGGRFMSVEDIIFLLRKDKEKLKRLIRFLNFKELKNKSQKQTSQDDDEVLEATVIENKGSKRRKISYDFVGAIDQTGELLSLFDDDDIDEIKQERNERADRLSRTLDPQQYMEFTECRQTNFNKKAGKFKEWLDCASLIDLKPNTPVMEIFSFLAYETVAQGSAASLSYSSGDCLLPHHIREAIRRYNHYIGPMAPFSAHVKPSAGYRTLCC